MSEDSAPKNQAQRAERLFPVHDTRSRAGDFLYCGFVGVMAIVSLVMFHQGGWGEILAAIAFFLAAILIRFFTLADAKDVETGLNVNEQQRELVDRLRAILNALPQPVMLLSADNRIDMYNPAAAAMFGGQLADQHITAVIRAPRALEILRTAQQAKDAEETEVADLGREGRVSLFYAAPLYDTKGDEPGHTIIMLRDRTEQKRLERMRSDFVASASHELRTPLASMLGFIETLRGHAKDDPQASERFLGIMESQAERMLRLVEDLINLSALELKELKPPTDHLALDEVLYSVVETLGPIVDKHQGKLTIVKEGASFPVIGDRLELFRLFQNLCDNALKYGGVGDKPPRVRVVLGRGAPPEWLGADRTGDSVAQIAVRAGAMIDDLVWASVRDEGEGIDRDDLPRLTERFYRVNTELSKAKGGTGLGLAIVKHILQRHRGGLQISSLPGEGASFTIILPPAPTMTAK